MTCIICCRGLRRSFPSSCCRLVGIIIRSPACGCAMASTISSRRTMTSTVSRGRRFSCIIIRSVTSRCCMTSRPRCYRYSRCIPRSGCLLVGIVIRSIRSSSAM